MSASAIYGVPEFKASIHKQKSGKYSMENVKCDDLPAFTLKAGYDKTKSYYGVRIVNGNQSGAGTRDNGVHIVLVGTKGCTNEINIFNFFSGITGNNQYMDIVVKTQDLGTVQVFIYGNNKGFFITPDMWYVEFSVVYPLSSGGKAIEFPCYHWIGDDETASATSATTTLKDAKNDALVKQRTNQLSNRKLQYVWRQYPETGLPSSIDENKSDVPTDEQFESVKATNFSVTLAQTGISLGLDPTIITNLDSFIDLADNMEVDFIPLYKDSRWASDVEFGRQILNGVNAIIIEKCTSIPSKFPVTNKMVQPYLTRGKTLEQEIAGSRVYICDMVVMDGVTPRDGYVNPAPICLLYVNSADQLVPIAIQIKQGLREEERKDPNPIFFPNDGIDWTIAKIYYRAADSQFHEIFTHYLSCHAIMETYSMGVMRNLPDAHPINKLLRPHFRYTMGINTRARSTLINDGGIIDQGFGIGGIGKTELMQKGSEVYSVLLADIKKNTKQRGVDNASQLPGYYFRDDGYLVWDATEKYVRSVINQFYSSDADVKGDREIQDFANDLYTNGFPSFYGGKQGHDFPQAILTKECLIENCTRIIFNGSAQHAAVNFGQYQIYSYVPNAPLGVRCSPPTKKGEADEQKVISVLSDKKTSTLGLILTYLLTQYGPKERFLGDFPSERFVEKAVHGFIQTYQDDLAAIDRKIDERNKGLEMPYTFMQPKKIPNSITI